MKLMMNSNKITQKKMTWRQNLIKYIGYGRLFCGQRFLPSKDAWCFSEEGKKERPMG